MRACVCRWPRPGGVRTSNFYAQYSTGKHKPALRLWNAKNGEKNPDNVPPERRAHCMTHGAAIVGGGRRLRAGGVTAAAAYGVFPPLPPARLCMPCQCRSVPDVTPVFRSSASGTLFMVPAARRCLLPALSRRIVAVAVYAASWYVIVSNAGCFYTDMPKKMKKCCICKCVNRKLTLLPILETVIRVLWLSRKILKKKH